MKQKQSKSAFAVCLENPKHLEKGSTVETDKPEKREFKVLKKLKPSKKIKNIKRRKKSEYHISKDALILKNAPVDTNTKVTEPSKKKKKAKGSDVEESFPKRVSNGIELCDSATFSEQTFSWLINPIRPSEFFKNAWEQKPLLITRHDKNYYKDLFSTKEFNQILNKDEVYFSTNLDVTVYKNGKRQTLNPSGRAYASRVWTEYEAGHSIRMLNPQTFSKSVWNLLTTLQEYFNCGVGVNMYLTPPGSQGFAPHYDDIEAFVIQLEGRKKWKLYEPRTELEDLPRFSSGNFTEEEIGTPILDICLNEGDVLYFPRGIIHQASPPDDAHSLHLTISTFQRNTWTDLLEKLIPRALECAVEEDIDFRRGLPVDYLSYMGLSNSDTNDPRRQKFKNMVEYLVKKLMKMAPVDAAVDQVSKDYIYNCLPPYLTKEEKKRSINENQTQFVEGKILNNLSFQPGTEIRLIRKTILRLVAEDTLLLYHSVNNSRVYREREMQCFEISGEAAEAVEELQHSYPKFLKISELPIQSGSECMEFVLELYKRGLLMTREVFSRNQ